jgi:hypothetical protein
MQSGLCSCDFLCLFVTEEMRGGEMSLEHPGRFGQVWSMRGSAVPVRAINTVRSSLAHCVIVLHVL